MRPRRALTAGVLAALLALTGVGCEADGAGDAGAEPGGDPATTGPDTAEPGDEVGDEGGALPDDTRMDDTTGG
jgi:hypothetical protein